MLPIGQQFSLIPQAPLLHYGRRLLRKLPFLHLAGTNLHQCLKPLILDVDVGWWMIIVLHAHDDAEENGQNGHAHLPLLCEHTKPPATPDRPTDFDTIAVLNPIRKQAG